MKERLTNSLGLKVLAISLALFLWLIVPNIFNPVKQDSKEAVVDTINKEVLAKNSLTYEMVGRSSVTVYYDVYILDVYKISSSDFYAYADLLELYDVIGSIPIKIDIVNNKGLISGTPATKPGVIQIKTEEIQEKPSELWVHNKTGAPADGHTTGEIILTPRAVYATGPASSIGQINSIGVDITIDSEATGDYTAITTPIFHDVNGNSLNTGNDVTSNTTEITYRVTVLRVKELGLDSQARGSVADGYRFIGVDCDMRSVSVEGMKFALVSLSTLVIPPEYLNLDGATSDVVVQVNLAEPLPEEVTIAGNEEVMVTAALWVEPLEARGLEVELTDAEPTRTSDELRYELNVTSVQVDIEDLLEDFDALDERDLKLVTDVSHMVEGEHRGMLALTPGPGLEAINTEGLEITVTAKDPANSSTSPNNMTKGSGNSTKETTRESTKKTTKASQAGNRTNSLETIKQRQKEMRGMAYGQ